MASAEPKQREAWRAEAAECLRAIAAGCEGMADALDQNDDLLGVLAGMGLSEHLPLLPKHVRDTFMEYLDDEAAEGAKAAERYWAWMEQRGTTSDRGAVASEDSP